MGPSTPDDTTPPTEETEETYEDDNLTDAQRAFLERYPREQRMAMLEILDEHRERMIERLKFEPRTTRLFAVYMEEVRKIFQDDQLPAPILDEIRRIMRETFDVLRELARDTQPDTNVEHLAKKIIEITKEIAHVVVPPQPMRHIEYSEIPTSDVLRLEDVRDHRMRANLYQSIGDLVLPPGDCGYKGGVARLALKLHAYKHYDDFDPELLHHEMPLSDKDAVFGPNIDAWKTAEMMGVDPDGVERMGRFDEFGIMEHLNARDVDMNQAFLTPKSLYFTPEALESVRTGVIHCAGRAKTLFGVDTFMYGKRLYFTNKILNRLVIAVSRKRARWFEIPRYNSEIQLGIYWLVLIRKVYGKPDTATQVANIFSCAKQMEQTDAATPKDFIRVLMEKYRKFDFVKIQTTEDIARWILSKHITAIQRHLKGVFKLHPPWKFKSTDPTPTPIKPDPADVTVEQRQEALEYIDSLYARRQSQIEAREEGKKSTSPLYAPPSP